MDIWRSIADIGPPALEEMIEIGALGVSLTSPQIANVITLVSGHRVAYNCRFIVAVPRFL